jgi:hypothetical protein
MFHHPSASAGQDTDAPQAHSSLFYMGVYAAISGAQLLVLQINYLCVAGFGIKAGRCAWLAGPGLQTPACNAATVGEKTSSVKRLNALCWLAVPLHAFGFACQA